MSRPARRAGDSSPRVRRAAGGSRRARRAGGATRARRSGGATHVRRAGARLPPRPPHRPRVRRALHRVPSALRAACRRPLLPGQDVSRETFVLLLFGAARPDGRNASRGPRHPPAAEQARNRRIRASRARPGRHRTLPARRTPPRTDMMRERVFQRACGPTENIRNRVIPCETKREERMQLFGHCAPMRPSRRKSVQFSPRCCSPAASKMRSRPRSLRRPGETFAIEKAREPGEPAYVTFR